MPRFEGITDEMIVEKHRDGYSYKEMAEFCGLTDRAIRGVLVKHGVKLRKQYSGQPRKYKVNEDFFKEWSHEMAWVFGFLVADGYVVGENHQIGFAQKDVDVLNVVAEYMDADKHIITYDRIPRLIINSKIIKNDLLEMGITNNKSNSLPFPVVPKEYLPSFIRGVVDGDGWVQKTGYVMNITTGSIDFAKGLKSVFDEWGLFCEIKTEENNYKNTVYRVWVKGKYDIAKLSKILYDTPLDTNCLIYKQERMSQRNDLLVESH